MRVKSWDEFYQTPKKFDDLIRWASTHSRLIAELVTYERVLEVGTGTGLLAGLLGRFCGRSVSLDDNESVIRNARLTTTELGAPLTFIRGDAFAMPFASDSFEAAFSQGLLEHFSDEDIVRLVQEQVRVAKVVYISVPSFFYPHIGRFGPGLIGNERLMTLRRWRQLLREFDLDGCEYYSDFKVATFAGKTIPWPSQALIRIRS